MSDENLNIEDKLQKIKQEIEDRISAIEEKNTEDEDSNDIPIIAVPNAKPENVSSPLVEIVEESGKPKKKKKNKFLVYLIPILFITLIFFGFLYIKDLKKELDVKKGEIQKIKDESIDYNKDSYYKELEEELTDDEEDLQDFSVYKDVNDPYTDEESNENVEKSKISNNNNTVPNNTKAVNSNSTSSNRIKKNNKKQTTKTVNSPKTTTNTKEVNTSETSNNATVEKNKPFELYKEDSKEKEVRFTSDMMQIIALEHVKGDKYIIPKKAKKTNSFKVRVRLNKPKRAKVNEPVEIMLVIKDAIGKTLKIDVKKVNFNNNDLIYTIFYSQIKEKLIVDQEYTFNLYANKRLLKTSKKRI